MISEENLVCNEMQQRNRIMDRFKDSTASKPHQQTCVQLRRKGGKDLVDEWKLLIFSKGRSTVSIWPELWDQDLSQGHAVGLQKAGWDVQTR